MFSEGGHHSVLCATGQSPHTCHQALRGNELLQRIVKQVFKFHCGISLWTGVLLTHTGCKEACDPAIVAEPPKEGEEGGGRGGEGGGRGGEEWKEERGEPGKN